MRLVAKTDVAVNNGGGIRRSLEEGEVTVGDMYEILPFDNYIETMEVTGATLKNIIQYGINPKDIGWGQYAGIKVYYNPETYEINDITLLDGTKVEDDKYYTLATNDFMVTDGDGYDFSNAKNIYNTNICMRDSIMDYWKENRVPAGETKLLLEGKAPVINNEDNNTGRDNIEGGNLGDITIEDNNAGNNTVENGTESNIDVNNSKDELIANSDKNNSTDKTSKVTNKNNAAKTYDNAEVQVYTLMILLAISGVAVAASRKRKRA
ncbi:5'-nucleotidase, C-terminal domain [Clostridium sp. DSM 8431]|nr:5'-nucleotidase, C-terminal domain [Clostridium sp. DSM 8431]